MRRMRRVSTRRSFTLLEVLIAIGLSLALLSSVFTFYFNVLRIRRNVHEQGDVQRAATLLVDRLEGDLLTCTASHGSGEAGVRGDGTSLTIASRGVSTSLAQRGLESPAVFGDLQVTTYRFNTESGRLTMRRQAGRETDDVADESLLSERIAKVRFRYYDGSQWRDQFNSRAANALPIAVEVAIWFDSIDEDAPREQPDGPDATPAQPMERRTFDAEGGFDEFEYAMRDDRGFGADAPLPDRFRVIAVPDAAEPEDHGRGETLP